MYNLTVSYFDNYDSHQFAKTLFFSYCILTNCNEDSACVTSSKIKSSTNDTSFKVIDLEPESCYKFSVSISNGPESDPFYYETGNGMNFLRIVNLEILFMNCFQTSFGCFIL